MNKIKYYCNHPNFLVVALLNKFSRFFSDKLYLKILYFFIWENF